MWEGRVECVSETLSNTEQFFKWTVPTIKEATFVRIINSHLRTANRRLKNHVKDLEERLELIHDELKSRGIKMIVIEEPIAQTSVNEEGRPQGS